MYIIESRYRLFGYLPVVRRIKVADKGKAAIEFSEAVGSPVKNNQLDNFLHTEANPKTIIVKGKKRVRLTKTS